MRRELIAFALVLAMPAFGQTDQRQGAGGAGRMGGNNPQVQFQPGGPFSVVIIGSGGPPYNPDRSGPSAVIQYHGRYILVDMGNGTQARLYQAGISSALIDAFFITHHHIDHDEEFIPMLDKALVRGLPLEIVGTPGTKKVVDFTEDFYAQDIVYRIERTGRSAQDFPKPSVMEIQGGESFKVGALQVTTAQVPHSIHTVAYRFDADGKSIVISGDLTYSDKLIALAHNADVLVMDSGGAVVRQNPFRPAGAPAAGPQAGGGGGGQPMAHALAVDVCNMAQKAGVKKLVLTHIVPPHIDEQATINTIHQIYKGEVIVGHDLLQIVPGG